LGGAAVTLLIEQFLNFDVMRQSLPLLLKGLMMTLILVGMTVPLGISAGLALALASLAGAAWLRRPVRLWVNLFRALPPIVLIILAYSALPHIGLRLSAFSAVILGLTLNNSAYYCEILRAGLISVPQGQMEAARSSGLSRYQALRHVVIPQALRNVLPDLVSNTIEVVKATSIASIVAVNEMLFNATLARSVTYNASPITLAAIIYLVILLPAVRLTSRLENRIAAS
jgi:polar amino acid transport system permease protein